MSTVIRVEKNREYVVLSNKFLRNKQMSLKAKGLLALCLSLPDDWDYSMNGLVAITKESITAIRNTMRELEELGYMSVNKLKNDKGQFRYEYIIREEPEGQKPSTDNLQIDELNTDKSDVANDIQQSIDNKVFKNKVLNNNLYILDERLSPEISKLFKEYLEMREEEKMPVSERGLQTLLTRLEKLSNNNVNVQKIMLSNATLNKWKNIYKPSDQEIEAYSKALVESLKSFYHI